MNAIEKLRQSTPVILPSMLKCDFSNIELQCKKLADAGAQALHLDVMDGVFVENMTYGLPILEAFRKSTDLVLDVHLMIQNPEKYVGRFAEAGADILTIHEEATDDPAGCIELIRQQNVAAGIAVNPDTDLNRIDAVSKLCDLVLIMSVHAGFGGQSFIENSLTRIREMRSASSNYLLEVDGGINEQTIARCGEAGVDLFVVGSAIFDKEDYETAIRQLTELADSELKNA